MDASTEDEKKPFHQFLKAIALGNVYTTTSLFYQWKYLSALSEQQLIYSKCVLKSLKRLEKSQKQNNNNKFGLFKSRVEAESDSVDSDIDSDVKKPTQTPETQSPVAPNDNTGAPVNLQSSPIRTPINQPSETASQTLRSGQTDFPFALYIKLLAFLIIIKAHRLLMYSYTFIVTCHFLGVFNPIIHRIKAYFIELGFNDTQQLHLVLRKLKARQQMQAQQVQSEIVAMQILQDLRQLINTADLFNNPIVGTVCTENSISASEIANGVVYASAETEQVKEMNCDDILIQDENDCETSRSTNTQHNLISQSKAATEKETPSKQFNRKLYIMQFIYQLFFAFILSLNPRWEPICMLVYDDYKPDNSESQQ